MTVGKQSVEQVAGFAGTFATRFSFRCWCVRRTFASLLFRFAVDVCVVRWHDVFVSQLVCASCLVMPHAFHVGIGTHLRRFEVSSGQAMHSFWRALFAVALLTFSVARWT